MKEIQKISSALFLIMVLLILVAGCSSSTSGGKSSIAAGSFTGTAPAYHGTISVTVEVDEDGIIKQISVGENHQETDGVGTVAIKKIPQRIIDAQSLNIDVVSGATRTSNGIINAVADALKTAGADPVVAYGYVPPVVEEVKRTPINKDAMPVKKEITGSVTVKDAKGRDVTIDLPISSYAISTMDVIDYIIPLKGEDAFHMLVGSGQDGGGGIQKYEKLYVPIVGNYMEHMAQISDHNAPFDLEMILSMDPDVIIVNSAMAAHKYALEIEDKLTEAGIPIVLIDVPGKKLDTSVQETMKVLGQIFQEEDKANEVAAFVDEQFKLIASKNLSKRSDKPTVYYEKSGYSEIYGSTATSKSGWGLPISIAGGANIADPILLEGAASGGSSNTLDPEYVIKADPDFIFVSGINEGWLDKVQGKTEPKFDIINRVGWSDLKAVKNGDLYEFVHSSSRSIYAFYPCLKMAKILYPEEFTEVDPDAILDDFFDRFMLLDSDISTWFWSLEDGK